MTQIYQIKIVCKNPLSIGPDYLDDGNWWRDCSKKDYDAAGTWNATRRIVYESGDGSGYQKAEQNDGCRKRL